jgi:hypothetical protein
MPKMDYTTNHFNLTGTLILDLQGRASCRPSARQYPAILPRRRVAGKMDEFISRKDKT